MAGAGSNPTELVKGVPAVLPVSWGRETSAPGCFAPAARVHAGTSRHAAATDGRLVRPQEGRPSGSGWTGWAQGRGLARR